MYKMWQKVGKQRNPDEWEMTPATVNAYYNPPANEVSEPVRSRRWTDKKYKRLSSQPVSYNLLSSPRAGANLVTIS
jgi:hypothetical protein